MCVCTRYGAVHKTQTIATGIKNVTVDFLSYQHIFFSFSHSQSFGFLFVVVVVFIYVEKLTDFAIKEKVKKIKSPLRSFE